MLPVIRGQLPVILCLVLEHWNLFVVTVHIGCLQSFVQHFNFFQCFPKEFREFVEPGFILPSSFLIVFPINVLTTEMVMLSNDLLLLLLDVFRSGMLDFLICMNLRFQSGIQFQKNKSLSIVLLPKAPSTVTLCPFPPSDFF